MSTIEGTPSRSVWDYAPTALTVVVGILTNWLSELWRPTAPVALGATLIIIIGVDRYGRRGRSGGSALSHADRHVLPLAAAGLNIGFLLGWIGSALPPGPYLTGWHGWSAPVSEVIVGVLVALPGVAAAYKQQPPVLWINYNAFTAFAFAVGLSYTTDYTVRMFFWWFALASTAAAFTVWWRGILAAFLEFIGMKQGLSRRYVPEISRIEFVKSHDRRAPGAGPTTRVDPCASIIDFLKLRSCSNQFSGWVGPF